MKNRSLQNYFLFVIVILLLMPLSVKANDTIKKIATGNFPDIAVDKLGNIHVVYNRGGLKYIKYDIASHSWSSELDLACNCATDAVARQNPDIVIDSKNNPHMYCGNSYARLVNDTVTKISPHTSIPDVRDSELAITSDDTIYLIQREGFEGGHIGLQKIFAEGDEWIKMEDPDKSDDYGDINNHVYPDIAISPVDNSIHIVQRHGPEIEVTYRSSKNYGRTWARENVSSKRAESPHIMVDYSNNVFICDGSGYVMRKSFNNTWYSEDRVIVSGSRDEPELGVDKSNTIYVAIFGGKYTLRDKGIWLPEKKLTKITSASTIGFVESVGVSDFAYFIWEEGSGDHEWGLNSNSSIFVAKVNHKGEIFPISLDNLSPVNITLTSHINQQEITSTDSINFVFELSEPDIEIDRVELYINNKLISSTSKAPYTIGWLPDKQGTFEVMGRVVDIYGNTWSSGKTNINLTGDFSYKVALASPVNQQEITSIDSVDFVFNITGANVKVKEVELIINEELVSSITQAPYAISWLPKKQDTIQAWGQVVDIYDNIWLSDTVTLYLTGNFISEINQTLIPGEVEIYPNPTDDIANIRMPKNSGIVNSQVIDASGRIILQQAFKNVENNKPFQLNLSQIKSGIYILKMQDETCSYIKNCICNRQYNRYVYFNFLNCKQNIRAYLFLAYIDFLKYNAVTFLKSFVLKRYICFFKQNSCQFVNDL